MSASVVLTHHPHAKLLTSQQTLGRVPVEFPVIDPVHDAFDDMLQTQKYDVCEMAIVAFLQAYDAGIGVRLLPFVQSGGHQHRNLYPSPRSGLTRPGDLVGRRIGVKSYSQTTGLWVKGWLNDEDDVAAQDVTWFVTERSHVAGFADPDNVHLLDVPLKQALTEGTVDAAILGRTSAPADLEPLAADYAERDSVWFERNGATPINHMVLVKDSVATEHPDLVREAFGYLEEGLARCRAEDPEYRPAVRSGLEAVRPAIELAARYAYEQGLIASAVDDIESLFVFGGDL